MRLAHSMADTGDADHPVSWISTLGTVDPATYSVIGVAIIRRWSVRFAARRNGLGASTDWIVSATGFR
jgi:hypothetical protein